VIYPDGMGARIARVRMRLEQADVASLTLCGTVAFLGAFVWSLLQ
jgi:hypothetical protein